MGPMILPNPGTKAPLKFGTGNRYASSPTKSTIPATPAEFKDCIQRNNNRYAAMETEAGSSAGTGFGVLAVLPSDNLLIMAIKPNRTAGDLDTIRDALFSVGCTLACFTDGASSASLAVDGQMEPGMAPAPYKDNLIETGFGLFLYKPPPATNVNVQFTQVEVFDDASLFGSGTWTLTGTVLGSSMTLLNAAAVNTGDRIALAPGFNVTVTVPPGSDLTVSTSGLDSSGTADDLGTDSLHFGSLSSPAFGVGTRTLKTLYYRVTLVISIAP
jgi:hypothetical protein